METIKNKIKVKLRRNLMHYYGIAIINIVLILSLNSCAQQERVPFRTSSIVPAAEGRVTLKTDRNNNYIVEMEISNLADVQRLDPPRKIYVAWIETQSGVVRNLGQVITSGNLNASLETVVPGKPARIFITAENDESVTYPGNMVVLTTEDF
jgi:hypothetical protein